MGSSDGGHETPGGLPHPYAPTTKEENQRGSGDHPEVTAGARSSKGYSDERHEPQGGLPHPSAPNTKPYKERGSGDPPEVTAGARSSIGSSDETDVKNPRGGYHTPAYPEQPTYGLQDYEGKEKEERPPNLRSKRKRKRPPREGGHLPLDPGGRGGWGPRGTWGSLGPIVLQIALFVPCKRAPRRRTASGGARKKARRRVNLDPAYEDEDPPPLPTTPDEDLLPRLHNPKESRMRWCNVTYACGVTTNHSADTGISSLVIATNNTNRWSH
jgi:hypothetical protein